MIVWLQLAFGTWLLLLPGRFVARALGVAGAAGTLTWSVALAAGALAVTFAVHGPLLLTLALVLAAGAVAFPFSRRREEGRSHGALVLAGLAFGGALWFVAGVVGGDGLFHLGRVRKLTDFGSLSLRAVDEFRDGGLHPGYAFPLWHGWLALVGKVTALDPTQVVLHESSLLVPLALVLAYELGREVFRSSALGVATMLAQVGIIALAPGSGGAYRSLALPGTASRQLLVPAATILFFRLVRAPSWPRALTLALAATAIAFVHPTYALFLAIVLVGYAAARLAFRAGDLRENVAALVSFGLPLLLVYLWLRPIVNETESRTAVAQGLQQYEHDLVVHSPSSYHLAPAVVSRTGAIAIAALVLAPLAAFAARRRWAALVLGGTALVLALVLWPLVFPRFSDLVSLSQSRRAAGFVPFALAFAGGLAVLARRLGPVLPPLALAAGIALQLAWPGDFGLHVVHEGPAAPAWIALFGCLAGLAVGALLRGRAERPVWLAAALFVLPVAVHGFSEWSAHGRDANALTPGLVRFLRHDVPERSVVYADLQTSYRISAYVPVYVANGPPTHVADTRANDPYGRAAKLRRFLRTGDLAIPRSYGAGWLVLRRGERLRPRLPLVYRDARFRVYVLS
ncbi:MAG TPA: hypothetical protein VFL60_00635 [Gaiellaceae bacterium]|nr:hypothetical protein [Gaiellaceae bacterium]